MTISKKLLAVAAAAVLTAATAVPALALENEFHGMYRLFLTESNFDNSTPTGAGFKNNAHSGFSAVQRARIMYTAKANDDLKLVTHFELDTRFGGQQVNAPGTGAAGTGAVNGYKGSYNGNDGGQLDADAVMLEVKNYYLDFNIPNTGVNVKTGVHMFADSYQWLFTMFDAGGVTFTKKFDPLTLSAGWFRLQDVDSNGSPTAVASATSSVGKLTTDLIFVDGKFAVSKDLTVGASYYNVQRDSPGPGFTSEFELLHMVGLNAAVKAGPVAVNPFVAYQFGDASKTSKISAYLAGVTSKTKLGPGNVNLSAFYLSGDENNTGDAKDFKTIGQATQYFGAGNMFILVRHPLGIAQQDSVGTDFTVGNRGMMAVFGGYEGTAGKVFYSANVGYARTAEQRTAAGVKEDASLGTEINATLGYKMFDNMTASVSAAYMMLGDGLSSATAGKKIAGFGAANADDPYAMYVFLNYAF